MDQKLVNEFLIECIIPGFRNALKRKDLHKIIELVVMKAHRDTMIGARFRQSEDSEKYCDQSEYYRTNLIEMLEGSATNISGRLILKYMNKEYNKFEVNIGLIQKLVNMSVKYLFVIEACGLFKDANFDIHVDEEYCDCPLDSKILEKLGVQSAWTKLKEPKEYMEIQEAIDTLGYKCRLQYDLEHWGLPVEKGTNIKLDRSIHS